MHFDITFDPLKDAINRLQHGVSLELAREIVWRMSCSKPTTVAIMEKFARWLMYRFAAERSAWSLRRGTARCASLACAARITGKYADMEHETFNGLILPTAEEEAEINRGIALDPDTWELTDEEFDRIKPYPFTLGGPPQTGKRSAL